MALLAIEDLSFSYPAAAGPAGAGSGAAQPALSDISLRVEAGEFVCLFGPNGSGKSTLLHHLKSVLAPQGNRSGHILFDGVPLEEMPLPEQASRIGFVMQSPDAQIVTDKVWHELAFGLESLGCDPKTIRLRVAEMASYFGIQDWFHRDVSTLSGGQKQILNLGSVMVMQPDILVLDEPTAQLDPIATLEFLETLRRINQDLGCTIIMAEHHLDTVYGIADTVVAMNDGRIVNQGNPRDVAMELHDGESPLAAALPSPTRIYYGVEASYDGEADLPMAITQCPLNVREGRAWLEAFTQEHPPTRTAMIPEPSDTTGETILKARDLWFRYERDLPDVLKGIDIELRSGKLSALVGGNGTGKSTLLRCLCGVAKPYRGSISLNGKKLKGTKRHSRKDKSAADQGDSHLPIALLPQDPQNIMVHDRIRDDLAEMLSDASLSKEQIEQHIQSIARTCAIKDILDAHPFDVSRGQLQRAALAKVLLLQPRILLLDEPTQAIDVFFARQLARTLREVCNQGTAVLMVSHDIEFCACHADHVSMIFDGTIVAEGTPREVFSTNQFYTTVASRMSRGIFDNAITDDDVIALCAEQRQGRQLDLVIGT